MSADPGEAAVRVALSDVGEVGVCITQPAGASPVKLICCVAGKIVWAPEAPARLAAASARREISSDRVIASSP